MWAGDRHISYLPLAHIYERVTLVGVTHGGVSVGFYRYAPPHCLSQAYHATLAVLLCTSFCRARPMSCLVTIRLLACQGCDFLLVQCDDSRMHSTKQGLVHNSTHTISGYKKVPLSAWGSALATLFANACLPLSLSHLRAAAAVQNWRCGWHAEGMSWSCWRMCWS